jgi:YegS/Rv2252/BmrU family lipid kinase
VRRHILIIVNPAAGRVRSSTMLKRTVAALERRGCSVQIRHAGEDRTGLEQLARDMGPGFDAVIAAGGDGTVDAVVNGLAAASQQPSPAFGLLPLGTVNLLAREIGLPRDPEALAAAIASGPVRQVWPGRVGDRLFMVVAGCGFDADIVAAVNPAMKAHLGRLAFAAALLCILHQDRRRALSLRIDGQELRAAAVIVAKGRYYAGPFTMAPAAAIGEPVFHAVLFRSDSRLAMLRYLAAIFCGGLHWLGDVEIRRCMAVSISDRDAAPVQADGEIVAAAPVTITVAECPLQLIWP